MNEDKIYFPEGRIYFPGNPWREGHPIREFYWDAEIRDYVWFQFHLKSEEYYLERDIKFDKNIEYESNWNSPIAWDNFNFCRISSIFGFDRGGFPVCPVKEYNIDYLDGLKIRVDPPPFDFENTEDLAFRAYVLGNDSVADHTIKFLKRKDSDHFDIMWKGKLALEDNGNYDYKYQFKAEIFDIQAPELKSIDV